MNQDEAFLADIIAHPDDNNLRLIYADWLEERGDPRAAFLRTEAELLAPGNTRLNELRLRARLRQMRAKLDPAWLAAMDRTAIERCPIQFEYPCPKRWELLQVTDEPGVRFCNGCGEKVYYCARITDAQRIARDGGCVAVDSRLERKPGDIDPPPTRLRKGLFLPPR